MAVDTRNKRASALNIASPWRSMLPAPDGALAASDRATVVFMYGGLADGGVPPADDVIKYPTIGVGMGISVSVRMGTR